MIKENTIEWYVNQLPKDWQDYITERHENIFNDSCVSILNLLANLSTRVHYASEECFLYSILGKGYTYITYGIQNAKNDYTVEELQERFKIMLLDDSEE